MQEEEIEIIEEPQSEPTPEQPQPPQPEKTKLDQFKDLLAQYPTVEEAKSHIKDIAKQLDCAPSLGYKAVKRIEKFGAPKTQAREPTVKIPAAEGEEIPEEEEAPIVVEEEAPTAPAAPTTTMDKILPIFERAIGRLFNQGLELISGSKEYLTDEETKDTATLLPIIIYRLTKTELNEDQFIDATCITHFGAIVLRVVKVKVNEYRAKKKEEKIVEVKPEPPQEETPQPPKEPTEEELEAKKREQRPPFLKKLS